MTGDEENAVILSGAQRIRRTGDEGRRARVSALRMLVARRLTEVQLWKKLELKGYPPQDVRETVDWCKRERYLDDRLFAQLYVEGTRKTVSNTRLVAEMIRRGVDRDTARAAVESAAVTQDDRLVAAFEKIERKATAALSYPGAARKLERLGFPASAVYRVLREHAAKFGPLAVMVED